MTMKHGTYIFAVGFVIHIRSALATLETVWLKDVTTNLLTEKRAPSNTDFPNQLSFHLTRRLETFNLNLRRNHDINPNPDLYFARKLQNGQLVLLKSRNTEKEDVAYYQDIKNWAFMTVQCVKKSNGQCDRIIRGNIRIAGRDYELQPAEMDLASRKLLEDPGLLGRQYVLQDQTHTQIKYSVENKDTAQANEKNIEQKRLLLLRRFQELKKGNDIPPSVATSYSRNISTSDNREGTDKSRQLPEIYHVKVAVLIDPGLWDFYYSMVQSSILTRSANTKKKIKIYYSHIMNGVHMMYNGIRDRTIRINVVLSEFIIFTSKSHFPHKSKVVSYDGLDRINGESYLNDTIEWDITTDARKKKTFSQGTLFTRYRLYQYFLNETEAGGLTYTGEVCNVGKRMSLVEKGGYVWMVKTAAHELGHSLGADHDGEGLAVDCNAEDSFIMAPTIKKNYPGKPYSKNPWLFSTCSVRLFKATLKHKTCVRNVGQYYDYKEYHDNVMKMPGEVYTVQEQCELVNGRKSVLCETASEDICLLMRCTDPKTGICLDEYHGAARGTECGRNRTKLLRYSPCLV